MANRFRNTAQAQPQVLSLGSPSKVAYFGFDMDTTDREDWDEMTSFEMSELGFDPSVQLAA